MIEIIQTENLTKKFGDFCAVDQINLSVKKGEIYGFLGLNGAGKTTTIRMLLGMIQATSGRAFLGGVKVEPKNLELWKRIGYLVEVPYAYPELTVKENLQIFAKLRLLKDDRAIENIMQTLKLKSYENRKSAKLSLGNAQRLGLAKALMHNPDILILDEPTNGLDPAGIAEIRALLMDLSQNHGVTVFVSSHILGEISKIATRIGIIHNGVLMQEMDTEHIDQLRSKQLLIHVKNKPLASGILTNQSIPFREDLDGNIIISEPALVTAPESITELLATHQCFPSTIAVQEEDLESYFFNVIAQKGGL